MRPFIPRPVPHPAVLLASAFLLRLKRTAASAGPTVPSSARRAVQDRARQEGE